MAQEHVTTEHFLKMSIYMADTDKRTKLLHHPKRGACTELQVLAVLEDISIARADCASALELQRLQPAELHGLIAALVDSEEVSGPLLRAAAKQQLVPKTVRAAPDWTKNVRILHNIMVLPNKQVSELPESRLTLHVFLRQHVPGHLRGGVMLTPTRKGDVLEDMVQDCTFFALHPSRPYARAFTEGIVRDLRSSARGFVSDLVDLLGLYTPHFSGPFTIGVWWQDAGIVALKEN